MAIKEYNSPNEMQSQYVIYKEALAKPPYRGFEYLLLFYLLPKELVEKTPLIDFPRNPRKVIHSEEWRHTYETDFFKLVLHDTWAFLVWPHFGIRGRLQDYSGHDYFWKLAHDYVEWLRMLAWLGLTADMFTKLPENEDFRYLTLEEASNLAGLMVSNHRSASNFDELKECIAQNRAFEDFDDHNSSVKIDFYRQYYHTRSKHKTVSLEEIDIQDTQISMGRWEEEIDFKVDLEAFMKKLAPKDQRIMQLLMDGYSKTEIAKMLGYANHGGVSKRVKQIAEKYMDFREDIKVDEWNLQTPKRT